MRDLDNDKEKQREIGGKCHICISITYTYKYYIPNGMWCWRRMQNISWTNKITNVDVLQSVKEERILLKVVEISNRNDEFQRGK